MVIIEIYLNDAVNTTTELDLSTVLLFFISEKLFHKYSYILRELTAQICQ